MNENNFFEDEDFQDRLVALLCTDVKALHDCAHLLQADDFKPLRGMRHGRPRWLVAERALEYFRKYREPIGKLLLADMLEYTRSIGMGERPVAEAREYIKNLRRLRVTGPTAVTEMVLSYKRQHVKARAIQQLIDLQTSGQLTDERWNEVTQQTTALFEGSMAVAKDYFEGLADRIQRRKLSENYNAVPMLFIDPLDSIVRAVGRGQLGVALAPPKRGKSLFLEWVSLAYTIQRLNVMHFTLEDPESEVEDRLDAATTKIPIHRLHERPKTVARRFLQFRRMVNNQLRLVDGTQGGFTVPHMEQILLREREHGFRTDALIVDYDDEIKASRKQTERRFEFADIYRDLRQLAARHGIIVWTAAQTQRDTESLRILSGSRVAEDFSKIRKATMVLSLGQGDWGPNSVYLWVAAHKHDRMHIGCNIMTDRRRMLFYDRDMTQKKLREEGERSSDEE